MSEQIFGDTIVKTNKDGQTILSDNLGSGEEIISADYQIVTSEGDTFVANQDTVSVNDANAPDSTEATDTESDYQDPHAKGTHVDESDESDDEDDERLPGDDDSTGTPENAEMAETDPAAEAGKGDDENPTESGFPESTGGTEPERSDDTNLPSSDEPVASSETPAEEDAEDGADETSPEEPAEETPAKSARKDEWIAFAEKHGYDVTEGLTTAQLIARYGQE